MAGVLELAPPLWLQRYVKSGPSMNIHSWTELNASYKHIQFTVQVEGVAEHLDPVTPTRRVKL